MRLSDLVPAIAILTTLFGCDRSSSAGQSAPVKEIRYVAVDKDDVDREYRVRFNGGAGTSPSVLVIGSAERPFRWYEEWMSIDNEKRQIDFALQITGGNSYAERMLTGQSRRCLMFSAEMWKCEIDADNTRIAVAVNGDTLYKVLGSGKRQTVHKYVRD